MAVHETLKTGRRLREVLHDETRPLLVERVRATCWLATIGIAFSIFSDIGLSEPARSVQIATKLAGAGVSVAGLLFLRRLAGGAWRRLAATSVAIIASVMLVSVVGAVVHEDPLRSAFTLSFISLCTAVALPWGALPQAAVGAVAAIGVLVAAALRPPGMEIAQNTLVAVLAVIGASVYLAAILHRQRRERAWADLLQDGQKHVLELIAQDAPLRDVFTALVSSVVECEPELHVTIQCDACDEDAGAPTPDPDRKESWTGPISTAVGSVVGTIRAYKAAEEQPSPSQLELLQMAADLAGIAIERTQSREALVRARDAAQEAARAKGEFVANMSHEIRTPLNGVIGMTGLLLDTALDHEQSEYAGIIRTSGESLLSIINDILDFSKIESGHVELERQPFEIARCVTEAMDLVALRAAEQHIELAYCLAPDVPPTIVGDVTRVRQILANLLGNAVKFTEQGEVVVSVDVDRRDGDHYELAFSVRDTGIGIPAERVDRLFKPFTQVDSSTTRRYGGTGLGLVIARRFSEMMGGGMSVESEEGVGSTFRFTIHAEAAATTRDEIDLAVLRGRRLLVVDDNATNRLILEREGQSWRMDVHAAASGKDTLEWLEGGGTFDVAILDFLMPDMDGVDLGQALRDHAATRTAPRILLSSVSADDMAAFRVDEAARQEFAAVLTKPIHLGRLGAVLASALGPVPGDSRPRATPSEVDAGLAARHPLRILLAEDNRINQRVATIMLERMGYRADVAANGLEAVEAISRQPYDVILMDMQMPEMDGVTATERIRSTLATESQPHIIAMTANASVQDREKCLAAGMNDFLAKPVVARDLAVALEKASAIDRVDVAIPNVVQPA